jgi:hypothetical protein
VTATVVFAGAVAAGAVAAVAVVVADRTAMKSVWQ